MLNHTILQGRLVKDPEIRYTNSKKAIADFRIAVDRNFKNSDGEKGTDFFNVVAFGLLAEHIGKYFRKGSAILVVGRLSLEQWTAKDGTKRESVEVVANEAHFCEAPKKEERREPAYPKNSKFTDINVDDADFPF